MFVYLFTCWYFLFCSAMKQAMNSGRQQIHNCTTHTHAKKKKKMYSNQFKLNVINMLRNGRSFKFNIILLECSVFTDWNQVISSVSTLSLPLASSLFFRFTLFNVGNYFAVFFSSIFSLCIVLLTLFWWVVRCRLSVIHLFLSILVNSLFILVLPVLYCYYTYGIYVVTNLKIASRQKTLTHTTQHIDRMLFNRLWNRN